MCFCLYSRTFVVSPAMRPPQNSSQIYAYDSNNRVHCNNAVSRWNVGYAHAVNIADWRSFLRARSCGEHGLAGVIRRRCRDIRSGVRKITGDRFAAHSPVGGINVSRGAARRQRLKIKPGAVVFYPPLIAPCLFCFNGRSQDFHWLGGCSWRQNSS